MRGLIRNILIFVPETRQTNLVKRMAAVKIYVYATYLRLLHWQPTLRKHCAARRMVRLRRNVVMMHF